MLLFFLLACDWWPWRLVAGAYFFAVVTQRQFYGQDWGIALPSQFLAMAPYLATVAALVVISVTWR